MACIVNADLSVVKNELIEFRNANLERCDPISHQKRKVLGVWVKGGCLTSSQHLERVGCCSDGVDVVFDGDLMWVGYCLFDESWWSVMRAPLSWGFDRGK